MQWSRSQYINQKLDDLDKATDDSNSEDHKYQMYVPYPNNAKTIW